MNDADRYFTHTIVGAPQTVPLGRRVRQPAHYPGALEVDAASGQARLGAAWKEWLAVHGQLDAVLGAPWRRPGRLRRFLARHHLLLLLGGWFVAAALGAVLAWQAWA